jgi:hypothetical protein
MRTAALILLLGLATGHAAPFFGKMVSVRVTPATNPPAPVYIQADAWLSFETQTNGFLVTSNFFGTNIIGGGLASQWSESLAKVLNPTISTNFFKRAPGYIVVAGTTNDDSGSTRGFSIDCNTNTQYWFEAAFSQNQATVSMAGWFMTTIPTDGSNFDTYDVAWIQSANGNQWSVIQFQNAGIRAHCADSGSNNSGKGNDIAFSSSTWYWWVLYYNQGVSSVMELYDVNGNLLGTSTCLMGTSLAPTVTRVGSGGHGATNAKFIYLDNVCWKFTNGFSLLRPR